MDNNLSCFFLQQGYSKKLLWFMVAPGKVRTLIVFLLDILYSRKPDKMESPIIKVVLFFQVSCIGHSWFRQGGSFLDVTNNSLCLDCKDFIFSIKTISSLIALSATLSKGGLSVSSKVISDPDLISA